MIESHGPIGASFEFDGKIYEIRPNILCGNNIRALKVHVKTKRMAELKEAMKSARGVPEAERIIAREMVSLQAPNLMSVMVALQDDPDAAALLLHRSCPQVEHDMDEAMRVVGEYPNFIDLVKSMIEATGVEDLGNSIRRLAREGDTLVPAEAGGNQAADQVPSP